LNLFRLLLKKSLDVIGGSLRGILPRVSVAVVDGEVAEVVLFLLLFGLGLSR